MAVLLMQATGAMAGSCASASGNELARDENLGSIPIRSIKLRSGLGRLEFYGDTV